MNKRLLDLFSQHSGETVAMPPIQKTRATTIALHIPIGLCAQWQSTILPRTMEETALKHPIPDAFEPKRELHLRDANIPCMSTVGPCPPRFSRLNTQDLTKSVFNNMRKPTCCI